MRRKTRSVSPEFAWHAGQVTAIGDACQRRLAQASAVVIGCGRIGSSVALGLHASGFGQIILIDGQHIEVEQLGPSVFAQGSDVAASKSEVLARFLARRGQKLVTAIAVRVEDANLDRFLRQEASIVISCPNQIDARLYAEERAIAHRVPIIQAAAFDSRDQLGGMISKSLPVCPDLACYGCLGHLKVKTRSSALLTSVTGTIGQFATHLATLVVTGLLDEEAERSNLLLLDLQRFTVEALTVNRRLDCAVCAKVCEG